MLTTLARGDLKNAGVLSVLAVSPDVQAVIVLMLCERSARAGKGVALCLQTATGAWQRFEGVRAGTAVTAPPGSVAVVEGGVVVLFV
ncbi:hypothetical protein, partial [Cupriavidus sp. TA19]|uniref:hypothetical protein n=1 Tax=Cupriavidus sp. TA19 TaxID=701108 RepID=UPI00295EE137